MKFWIGTSGFQYAEWKGNFYPEDLSAAKMLPFYAERLSTTEINYTFHRIPAPKTINNWKALTPTNFQFALKAPQKITHWSKLRECADTLRYFHDVISALGEKQGPVLFQLPPNFKKDTLVLGDFLNGLPGGMRAAFELRREDYAPNDVERWTKFVREQESNWGEVFVYFKHEEAGIGPKLASQMKELLNCDSNKNPARNA